MWCASEVTPAPASVACTRAERAAANSARSRTTRAAPSPMTKPSRAVSNGLDASCGASLRVECAFAWENPASGSG